jgi:hypothetical protein
MMSQPSPLPRVLIDSNTVSQLDGKKGTYAGEERGYVRVDVDGFQNAMLFRPEELRRLQ